MEVGGGGCWLHLGRGRRSACPRRTVPAELCSLLLWKAVTIDYKLKAIKIMDLPLAAMPGSLWHGDVHRISDDCQAEGANVFSRKSISCALAKTGRIQFVR